MQLTTSFCGSGLSAWGDLDGDWGGLLQPRALLTVSAVSRESSWLCLQQTHSFPHTENFRSNRLLQCDRVQGCSKETQRKKKNIENQREAFSKKVYWDTEMQSEINGKQILWKKNTLGTVRKPQA